ncbi:daf-6 [Cordylochernes scorpioides]|uniref:Daf-6 n=1 Tax=Cordylochernes scorpioides TaxID=51811 RepID=A0ABY6LQW9_9ARAC|nr:daf-6 [Cordylochernes scorpioides]
MQVSVWTDVYVMLEAWKRSDPERTVAQRMGETMEHAGISITISSLTNCICFLIGAAAPLKFSYYFCMYAGGLRFLRLRPDGQRGGCCHCPASTRRGPALTRRVVHTLRYRG